MSATNEKKAQQISSFAGEKKATDSGEQYTQFKFLCLALTFLIGKVISVDKLEFTKRNGLRQSEMNHVNDVPIFGKCLVKLSTLTMI